MAIKALNDANQVQERQLKSKAPKMVYFGPKDPVTGDPVEDPRESYVYQEYPRAMYHPELEPVQIDNDEDLAELKEMDPLWQKLPFGITHPDKEQTAEMERIRLEAEAQAAQEFAAAGVELPADLGKKRKAA